LGTAFVPIAPSLGPKDGLLYVTTELDKSVTIIDPQTLKIVGNIPTGQAESHMLAISADGRYGYTANVGPGTVSVLDLAARKTVAVISVAAHVQRISISPDNRWVFTSDDRKPRLAVIDAATNKVDRWIALPGTYFGNSNPPLDSAILTIPCPGFLTHAASQQETARLFFCDEARSKCPRKSATSKS
jgi:YVTN family beta-propeller protein